jgi:hypothetical protein
MTDQNLEEGKLRLEEQRLELEKARLALEQTFSKKYATPLIGVLGALVAGFFALAQVKVAGIEKERQIASDASAKSSELEIARLERERRWKLDVADFVFRNREVLFSSGNKEEQKRIFSVMAITFPQDITKVIFENIKATIPGQQETLTVLEEVVSKQALTIALAALVASDLEKAKKTIQLLDANIIPADNIDVAKQQLQSYVRGARTPERLTAVTKAFKDAGIPLQQ